jgi:translation initiation factor 2 subunit 2
MAKTKKTTAKSKSSKSATAKLKTRKTKPAQAKTTKTKPTKAKSTKKPKSTTKDAYDKLYARFRQKIPPEVYEHKRFVAPQIESFIQGNMTFITNFKDYAQALNRKPEFILKFFTKEMATAGNFDGNRAIFQGKKSNAVIRDLSTRFIKNYVLCNECGKPDTRLDKQRRFLFLVCEACGAQESVKLL